MKEQTIIRILASVMVLSTLGGVISFYTAFQQNRLDPQAWEQSFPEELQPGAHPLAISWLFTNTPTPTITPTPTNTPTLTRTPTRTKTRTPRPTRTKTLTPTPSATLAPAEPTEPLPTETPVPPESAFVDGVTGRHQLYSLDCEARTATDLAAYFGIAFDEMDFQNRLPLSDDPEEGFVGSYNGIPGLPPNSYGVHARPVAALLREYGLNAYDGKNLAWEQLQNEIASGRPVMVWVVNTTVNGSPVSYTASNGNTTTVVYLEHTVLLVGYDSSKVTIVDGSMLYTRTVDQFLASWGALENMAVLVGDPQMIDQ